MQDINVYYQSLKQVYDRILHRSIEKTPVRERIADWVVGISVVMLVFSIIPVLPSLVLYVGERFRLSLGPISLVQFTLGAFLLTWLAITATSALLLGAALWINSKVDSSIKKQVKPSQSLSPQQLTFIAAYEAYTELKVYFVSHLEQHVVNCHSAVTRVLPSARHRIEAQELAQARMLHAAEMEMEYFSESPVTMQTGPAGLSRQITVAQTFLQVFESDLWFHLDPEAKATLQALVEFPEKVLYRLLKREDLPSVLSILESLSKFTFAFLPEHKTYMTASDLETLHIEGNGYLKRFVEEVNSMTSYSQDVQEKQVKTEVAENWMGRIRQSGYLPLLGRFALWFILILLLTTGGVYLASLRFTLAPDNMATLIIGTSVGGAAALTAILPKDGREDS